MSESSPPDVAIINFGMGNLFSVKQACLHVGLHAIITSSKKDILSSKAVILPGVGAFGDAIESLENLDLIDILHETAFTKPFIGICLGMQLLMTESFEFGHHKGLGIIEGSVRQFNFSRLFTVRKPKVPHIGWNHIIKPKNKTENIWEETLLDGLQDGEFMYFVHSYLVQPDDESLCLSITDYGGIEFCSSFYYKNIFACQFHPERSGPMGLKIYENLASTIYAFPGNVK